MHTIKKNIKKFLFWLISTVARIGRVNLLFLAYHEMGIVRSGDFKISGEEFFAKSVLPHLIQTQSPIIFDVGANVGEYSLFLSGIFPKARIFSFEPNPASFKELSEVVKGKNITPVMKGASSLSQESEMFVYPHNRTTQQATLYRGASTDIFKEQPTSQKISLTRLDEFAHARKIDHVDFLKIDIEGHELEALKGASELIKRNKIGIIQFEFNSTNIISRVFLKDFYDLLSKDFDFYRIRPHGLVVLGEYKPLNEIFRIHNLVAISKHRQEQANAKDFLHNNHLLHDEFGFKLKK